MNRLAIAMIVATSFLLCAACSTRLGAGTRNEDQAEAAKHAQQAYEDQAQAKLRELDQQIDALEARIRRGSKVERQRLAPQITQLERDRAVAHAKLKQLKNSSQEAWTDMKVGIDRAMGDLQAAYQRANADFK
jgi:predicted small secreted protein